MTTDSNLKLYFPDLNGLRFIAACFVIINPVEQLKLFYKIDDLQISEFARIIGKLGVMLFFVFSGFLITSLLLSEKQSSLSWSDLLKKFKKSVLLKYIVNLKVFYLTTIITIFCLLSAVKIPFFHYLFYSFLFAILIINLAANKKLSTVLEWNVLNYLGRISYGIYMYHFVILILVLKLSAKYNIHSNWFIYSLILIGTIIVSSISYYYFESFFLRLKTKFSFIKSGKI
ncbi:acyltransferase family protein [Polaribacter sp.]|uniref:acyltransferase family protein n=1 Tax=Polaribacter sp. TaxID=1920175 RepID=UPI003EF0D77C